MAANLTDQVRGIVKVVTAVANGNLRQKLTVEAKGEVAALAETINNMTDTLATFAEQVTNVAREVGVEGRLGGQANVPGAAGTWKDLTGNVNLLAANLTHPGARHRRRGDRRDQGRPDALDPGRSARRGRRAQGQHQHDDRQPARHDRAQPGAGLAQDQPRQVRRHAAGPARPVHRRARCCCPSWRRWSTPSRAPFTRWKRARTGASLRLLAGYAQRRNQPERIPLGEGLVGQCAVGEAAHPAHRRAARLHADPLQPGRGPAARTSSCFPVLFEGETKAVIELASLRPFPPRTSPSSSSSRSRSAWCSTPSRRPCAPRAC